MAVYRRRESTLAAGAAPSRAAPTRTSRSRASRADHAVRSPTQPKRSRKCQGQAVRFALSGWLGTAHYAGIEPQCCQVAARLTADAALQERRSKALERELHVRLVPCHHVCHVTRCHAIGHALRRLSAQARHKSVCQPSHLAFPACNGRASTGSLLAQRCTAISCTAS